MRSSRFKAVLTLGLVVVVGCQRRDLICETSEDCPDPVSDFCVDAPSVPFRECEPGYFATETRCLRPPAELSGCQCIVGRSPLEPDGGVPGRRWGFACFDGPYDAGSAFDGGSQRD